MKIFFAPAKHLRGYTIEDGELRPLPAKRAYHPRLRATAEPTVNRSLVSIKCPTEGCRELIQVELLDPDDPYRVRPGQKVRCVRVSGHPGCRAIFRITSNGKIRTIKPGKPVRVKKRDRPPISGQPSLAAFARLETDDEIRRFANQHGLLDVFHGDLHDEDGAEKFVAESLDTWRAAIREIRKAAAAVEPARKAKWPSRRLALVGPINKHIRTGVTLELHATRDKVIERPVACTLRAYLWAQVADELCDTPAATPASVRTCALPGCDKLVGIGQRADARTCSSNHRVRLWRFLANRARQIHQARPRMLAGEIVSVLRTEGWEPHDEKAAVTQVKKWVAAT